MNQSKQKQLKKLNMMSKNLSLYSNENDKMTDRTLLSNSKNKVEDIFNVTKYKLDQNERSDVKVMKRRLKLNNTSLDFNVHNRYASRSPRQPNPKMLMGMPKINQRQRNSSVSQFGFTTKPKDVISGGILSPLSMPRLNKKQEMDRSQSVFGNMYK
mgnify:CR=1 FL=1